MSKYPPRRLAGVLAAAAILSAGSAVAWAEDTGGMVSGLDSACTQASGQLVSRRDAYTSFADHEARLAALEAAADQKQGDGWTDVHRRSGAATNVAA